MKRNSRYHYDLGWRPEGKNQIGLKVLMFLFSPVLGLCYSLKSLGTKSTHIIIFLFCLCFGLAFTVSNVRTEGSIDGITYRAEFEDYQYKSLESFQSDFSDYLSFASGEQDFYCNSLSFLISRFTSNYHIFFLFAALIFSYFQLRSLRFLTSNKNFTNNLFCFILFSLFIWNQIFNINGLRFWTAAWIAVYSCFQLLVNKNKTYLLLALLTPFVHASYFLYIVILAIYYLFGRFEKSWTMLFLCSFVLSTITVELTRGVATYLPDILARKVDFYTDSQYIIERKTGTGFWFIDRFFSILSVVYVNLLAAILIFKNGLPPQSDTNRSLLRFLIIWMCFSNIFMPVPSVGGRFILLSYPIVAYLWLSYFSNKKYRTFILALPFVFAMKIYYMAKDYIEVLDLDFLLSPIYQVLKFIIFV